MDLSKGYDECKNFFASISWNPKRLQDRIVVAHNESFDRNVLLKSMALYGLNYDDLNLSARWECTVKFTKRRVKTNKTQWLLQNNENSIHHEALSDARACAQLFWEVLEIN
jgi:DNA polymerase-3 subunit epsilon